MPKCRAVSAMLEPLAFRHVATAEPSCDFGRPRLALPRCVAPAASSDARAAARPASVRSRMRRRSCADNFSHAPRVLPLGPKMPTFPFGSLFGAADG